MFGTVNVQKELANLAKEEQALRNKYGMKFKRCYLGATSSIASNMRIIDQTCKANVGLNKNADEAKVALEYVGQEV